MRDQVLAWNSDTHRCHGVKRNITKRGGDPIIRISRIPDRIQLPEVCMLVEKRPDIRQRGFGVYAELLKKSAPKQRKAS